jgi:AraC family transcriptional regulator, regulatory protein of adaptative response / methylated-DNA-[protein]-cysteine methyltransferase
LQLAVPEARSTARKAHLVRRVCDYIKENSASKVTLRSLGAHFGLSPFHLQKVFAEVMGISPRKYLEECRMNDLRRRLAGGEPVLNALRGSGYSSQSWLYEDSRTRLGMTPATYRKGGPGMLVRYTTGSSSIGRLLVAATEHGVCSVKAGRDDEELVRALRSEFPKAELERTDKVRHFLDGVKGYLDGQEARLPLDLRGTDFQLKVWAALRDIPLGETRSYSEVASMIGEPKAVRAVANACASNPVPIILPCHRVIRKDGSLGGYGLGLPRKRAILAEERVLAAKKRNE